MSHAQELIAQINRCDVPHGRLACWWLGQHSFIVKAGNIVLYLDPFLTDLPDRLVKSPLRPTEITNADIVCGSHDHLDHIDRPSWPALGEASPQATFVVPDLLRDSLLSEMKWPPERIIGLDDGAAIERQGVRITGIAAAHEFLDQDPRSLRYPYLGYVLQANGCSIYHSGDSCLYEGLQTKLTKWNFDAVFLPINGRDAVRLAAKCIGNMTYQEAADLAGALKPALTIPAHYGMFESNTLDPRLFADYMAIKYPPLKVHVPQIGEMFWIG